MLLSSILPALLLSLSLCKGTSAIETPPLEQGVELPGGDKTCPDTWFVPMETASVDIVLMVWSPAMKGQRKSEY